MNFTPQHIPDVVLIEPCLFNDERGYFFESFNLEKLQRALNRDLSFVQGNESFSRQNVIRGLHYQVGRPQGKLVRVVAGEVFDVAVDLRKHSPTFGQWVGALLSAENNHQLWIPEGFAHGFQVISATAKLQYLVTDYWCPQYDRCIRFDDPDIQVQWRKVMAPAAGMLEPILSDKDQSGKVLADAEVF
ncbi:dTDP-4-dehydrorhamnose 3,5-epimerase [Acerihabitans arboris]|uniref:dTDP-4-dehydrorhamnose 3,5-epimerase n=1 Tax=Acerihabitans arboris TaxID=2691583 RepID=A0A845SK48_9GAMM|nr:dTDP-4-dehydrorhamnose 3,5-epimerase [Acerihabitans arboris]NDL65643.1 dTDP-4-dehydrorhamnose 3,5-epimerase [Acerihabitans arboris]